MHQISATVAADAIFDFVRLARLNGADRPSLHLLVHRGRDVVFDGIAGVRGEGSHASVLIDVAQDAASRALGQALYEAVDTVAVGGNVTVELDARGAWAYFAGSRYRYGESVCPTRDPAVAEAVGKAAMRAGGRSLERLLAPLGWSSARDTAELRVDGFCRAGSLPRQEWLFRAMTFFWLWNGPGPKPRSGGSSNVSAHTIPRGLLSAMLRAALGGPPRTNCIYTVGIRCEGHGQAGPEWSWSVDIVPLVDAGPVRVRLALSVPGRAPAQPPVAPDRVRAALLTDRGTLPAVTATGEVRDWRGAPWCGGSERAWRVGAWVQRVVAPVGEFGRPELALRVPVGDGRVRIEHDGGGEVGAVDAVVAPRAALLRALEAFGGLVGLAADGETPLPLLDARRDVNGRWLGCTVRRTTDGEFRVAWLRRVEGVDLDGARTPVFAATGSEAAQAHRLTAARLLET